MSLPPLYQLRLEQQGDATGAPRIGGGNASGKRPAGSGSWQPAGDPGGELLKAIAKALKSTSDRKLRDRWKDAIVDSMKYKRKRFQKEAKKLKGQVADAQAKVDAYVVKTRKAYGNAQAKAEIKQGEDGQKAKAAKKAAKGGSSTESNESTSDVDSDDESTAPTDVAGDTIANNRQRRKAAPSGQGALVDKNAAEKALAEALEKELDGRSGGRKEANPTKWDVAQLVYENWSTLVYAQEAFEEIANAAEKREEAAKTSTMKEAEELANAITDLVDDYKNQEYLLESLSDLILAFMENPLVTQNTMINIVLMGSPGTGKTRLAEKLGAVLSKLGLFVYDEVVTSGRSNYIGEYEGQTAAKTRRFLVANLEKVIFLDEAYSLTSWEQKPGQPDPELTAVAAEAVAEFIAFMSEWPGSSCIIAAGYEKEMREKFLKANQGFTRRFYLLIELEDYTPEQLVDDIYIKALAKAMEGLKLRPPVTREVATGFFKPAALEYLREIIRTLNESPRKESNLHEFFGAQAGAMVILANITATKIASNADGRFPGKDSWLLSPKSVYVILQQLLENRFGLAAETIIKTELDAITKMVYKGDIKKDWGVA